ncbi:MAG: MBL fold metallo-hydrolase [Anaerolineae bacterium]
MYHTYRIKIGTISALIVSDEPNVSGIFDDAAIQGIFPAVPPDVLKELPHQVQARGFGRNLLYLEGDGRTVLIDTGEGILKPQRPGQGIAALQAAGVDLAAVQTVVITHLHGDHFGGLVDPNGQPNFPNASILIAADEWQYWMFSPQVPPERAAIVRPLMERFQPSIRLIDANDWITPEIGAVALPGHTPGHMGILVSSEGEMLFHVVDSLHMPMQILHPDISPRFDLNLMQAVETRRKALARAADENLLLMGYHLPFPGLGYVTRETDLVEGTSGADADAFVWEPLS